MTDVLTNPADIDPLMADIDKALYVAKVAEGPHEHTGGSEGGNPVENVRVDGGPELKVKTIFVPGVQKIGVETGDSREDDHGERKFSTDFTFTDYGDGDSETKGTAEIKHTLPGGEVITRTTKNPALIKTLARISTQDLTKRITNS